MREAGEIEERGVIDRPCVPADRAAPGRHSFPDRSRTMKKPHSLESLPRKPLARLIPLLARAAVLSAAAIASALFAPPSLAAPGDLDPAFAEVGRLGPL